MDSKIEIQELNLKQIQERGLMLITSFDQFAKENDIHYYLSGGTLLGAVRHKGFIPWDDDIDIMIPRPDYEKLIRIFEHPKYKLSCVDNDDHYGTPYARIWDTDTRLISDTKNQIEMGVFIDIFPIDGFPKSKLLTNIHLFISFFYMVLIVTLMQKEDHPQNQRYKNLKRILKMIFRKTPNYYGKKLNKYTQKYSYEKCDYVGVKVTHQYLFHEKNSKSIFAETKYFDFENIKLPVPGGYHYYLSNLYGNYMKLPPEDKRISKHNFHIYLK